MPPSLTQMRILRVAASTPHVTTFFVALLVALDADRGTDRLSNVVTGLAATNLHHFQG